MSYGGSGIATDEAPRLIPPPVAITRSFARGGRGRGGEGGANDADAAAAVAAITIPTSAYFAPPASTATTIAAAPEVVRVVEGVAASVRYVRGGEDETNHFHRTPSASSNNSSSNGGLRFPAARQCLWDAAPIANAVGRCKLNAVDTQP
jgi:hypothetical protein